MLKSKAAHVRTATTDRSSGDRRHSPLEASRWTRPTTTPLRRACAGGRLSPPRPGPHRLISPWEYRHLRVSGITRAAAGGFQLGIGLVLLSLGRSAGTDQGRRKMYRLPAWFLVPAGGNLAGGYWHTTITKPTTTVFKGVSTASGSCPYANGNLANIRETSASPRTLWPARRSPLPPTVSTAALQHGPA